MSLLISVIVPCYNAQKYIITTIRSILTQTISNLEVIVIDDGSTDNSAGLIEKLQREDARIRYIYQENQGLPGARNTGLDHAAGRYISFVDNDDLLHPKFLEILLKNLQADDADISVCEFENFDDGTEMRFPELRNETIVFDRVQTLDEINRNVRFVVMWNKLYRREIFDSLRFKLGKYHEDESMIHYIYDKARKTVKSSAVLYGYRNVKTSMARTALTETRFWDILDSLSDRERLYKEKNIPYARGILLARWNYVYWYAIRKHRAHFAMKYLAKHPSQFFRFAGLPVSQKPREYLRIFFKALKKN